MRLLLDTHIFLWFIADDDRLPLPWRAMIEDPGNDVFLSVVSMREPILKWSTGKLPIPAPPDEFLRRQRELHRIASLVIDETAVARLAYLPMHHKDPFDRMLVCQVQAHDLALVTVDPLLSRYKVPCLGMNPPALDA